MSTGYQAAPGRPDTGTERTAESNRTGRRPARQAEERGLR